MNGLRRIASAAVLLPVLLAAILLAPPWVFIGLTGLAIAVACHEAYRMLTKRGEGAFAWLGIAAALTLVARFFPGMQRIDVGLVLIAATGAATFLAMARRDGPGPMVHTVSRTVLPLVLIALPLSYVAGLRMLPGDEGSDAVLMLLICVMAGDTAAYYVGSTIGRRPLAPRLSPKKTVEGAVGGLFGSGLAAVAIQMTFYPRIGLTHAIILGLAIGVTGILGDLAESLMKRASGIKDSSGLIPGHGGLLDRTDSMLFSVPLFYYYHAFFLR